MSPAPDSANAAPWGARADGSPFAGPGLLARAAPFALVAVAATGLAFLLPWNRLPTWASVLVPLAYTGSVLALTLAAGTVSGVGIVILVPLIWTTLFHRRWESACVVAAIVTAEIVVSLVQSAPDSVVVRRVLLWGALGALLAVATHGLRDRIRRSQEATARLQEQVAELMLVQDHDRLAADLQSSVVRRIFSAGLSLQSILAMVTQPEVRRRVESSAAGLDEAIRLLRQAVDEALPAKDAERLLGLLRMALRRLWTPAGHTIICVEAAERLSVVVTATGPSPLTGNGNGSTGDLTPVRERAREDGIAIEVEPAADGTRVAWSVPLHP